MNKDKNCDGTNTGKNSVLIVDDEKSNVSALKSILSPEYVVYAALSGADAIEIADKYEPDVILLDILMPDMDGYTVIDKLKSYKKTKNIPVIFITALDGAEETGLSLGAADYIQKPFSFDNVKLRVMNQMKIVNQIRDINRVSVTDQLTNILNRFGFNSCLKREWGRSIREKLPISLLMIDVDDFKHYNDSYGHNQGDVVLKMVSSTLKSTLNRSTDIVGRWGGEEFVILLPNTEVEGARTVSEQIRNNIESIPIPLTEGGTTNITVSIGHYTLIPTDNNSMFESIDKADKALYEAKRSGRNKVCEYI
jgi:diguanylate cyclase (GGDEF)-like protein